MKQKRQETAMVQSWPPKVGHSFCILGKPWRVWVIWPISVSFVRKSTYPELKAQTVEVSVRGRKVQPSKAVTYKIWTCHGVVSSRLQDWELQRPWAVCVTSGRAFSKNSMDAALFAPSIGQSETSSTGRRLRKSVTRPEPMNVDGPSHHHFLSRLCAFDSSVRLLTGRIVARLAHAVRLAVHSVIAVSNGATIIQLRCSVKPTEWIENWQTSFPQPQNPQAPWEQFLVKHVSSFRCARYCRASVKKRFLNVLGLSPKFSRNLSVLTKYYNHVSRNA